MISSNPAGINCGQACSASFAEGTQVTLTASPAPNSFFAGWSGACRSTGACTVTVAKNTSVTASFSDSPTLAVTLSGTGQGTVASSPSGIDCGPTCSASFSPGAQVTLTATAATNSYFTGWGGACSGNHPTCTLTLSASQQATAIFDNQNAPVLTLGMGGTGSGTVSSDPAGISCAPVCKASFRAGTQVTLTATAGPNSSFAGWAGGGCGGSNPRCTLTLYTSQQVAATFNLVESAPVLTVNLAGNGVGTVASSPSGISCEPTCKATFEGGTQVTLTATPAPKSFFSGWGGACSGNNSTCILTLAASEQVTATFNPTGLAQLNHIIFLAQENRGLDHYFGELRKYWSDNGYPDQPFDGLPQFNPPFNQPPPAIPGCDPTAPPPKDCVFDPNNLVPSYHLITQCTENTSPSWNESHVDWDYYDPLGKHAAALNGVVWTAAHDARTMQSPFIDTDGIRAMGYYDGGDLNYYYFMASNFATSDRWFNPAMTRTHPNREYLIAGTSQGYAYPVGTDSNDKALLTATTIFQELQDAGISWKIYVNPTGSQCSGPPYTAECLLTLSYVQNFKWGQTIPTDYPQNIGTIGIPNSDFDNDLQSGTLAQVAQIEPASDAGLDEHPSVSDSSPSNIQRGAKYVSGIINEVMASTSWKDSAFILTYDEFGGLYDHVSPQQANSPDGIPPVDLLPGDICTQGTGPTCDFIFTGYRVPLIVVSPFAKQNYVSHTVADTTAILKLIETRFNLSPLTERDGAQMDMTEFFNFDDPAWLDPPNPPVQATNGACYLNKLP
jgi:phospholipase C